ncbi:MAG: bifunctional homocysteine S-methyltransferase/methylenetetrahydrofolate reductase [Dehalococcoidia bacterium]|nr:bifunctional homocysteine S-methyltransferase/methylenetetrahydrofolate reductase [Dehalococcoidia bacterium]
MKSPFLEALESRVLLLDGATGTMLLARGVPPQACIDAASLDQPALVRALHEEYIASGADIIETHTFGANRIRLARWGLEGRVRDVNFAAVRLARDAREIQGQPVFIAGSIGPTGQRLAPDGPLSPGEARAAFTEQIQALLEGGIDLLQFETFQSLAELREGIEAARALTDLPIVASMTYQEDGHTLAGDTPAEVAKALAALGVLALGVNCVVGPQGAIGVVEQLARATDLPLMAQPNAGLPRMIEGRAHYPATPQYFGESTQRLVAAGARIVGGCCGTTPEHIRAMRAALNASVTAAPVLERPSAPGAFASPRSDAPLSPEGEDEGGPRTLREKLASGRYVISVEIDPPRGINPRKAIEGAQLLKDTGADAINIGDSPMARVRMSAVALALAIQQRVGIETIIHCTTRDRNLMALQSDLIGAHALGVRNVIALTGDPPSGGDHAQAHGVWEVDSIGFIRVLKRLNEGVDWAGNSIGQGTDFFIAAAANPAADNLELELGRVRQKVEAGADMLMTQPVWDPELVRSFFRRLGPIAIPVLLGVLPLQNHRHAEFLHNELAGVSIPEDVRERMRKAGEAGIQEGLAIARDFLAEMRGECAGIYIMPSFGRYEVAAELVTAARALNSTATA